MKQKKERDEGKEKGGKEKGGKGQDRLGTACHCHNSPRPTTLPGRQTDISEVNLSFVPEGLWLLGNFIA